MVSKEITINNASGMHTRPANVFVKEAKAFESKVTLSNKGKEVDGKSLLNILKLGIVCQDVVTLSVDGVDEEQACNVLSRILETMED